MENAAVLEYIEQTAYHTLDINGDASMSKTLFHKHYLRKHGKNAYYGQGKT